MTLIPKHPRRARHGTRTRSRTAQMIVVAAATWLSLSACSTTRKVQDRTTADPDPTGAPATPPPRLAPAQPATTPTSPSPATATATGSTPPASAAPPSRPSPGATRPVPCASTRQCARGQICSTETGDCDRPPGCGPNAICPAVCWGHCTTRARAAGVRCGTKVCPTGQVCCNPSCGICTPPDGFCTQQICEPSGEALP